MEFTFRLTRRRVALLVGLVAVSAVGIGYAAIPAGDKVFHGCVLNATGMIRLVDTEAAAPSPLGRPCNTRLETTVSWNQQGIPGLPGGRGDKGEKGDKGDKGDTGPAGSAPVYTNYGQSSLQDIAQGTTQTVASVTLPTGSYTLSATVAVSRGGDDTRFGQCFFAPAVVHGTFALAAVADVSSSRLPVIGDVTVTSAALPVFLRCTGVDGPIKAAGALIATRVGTITPSE